MEIFDMREFDGHELVVFGHDATPGLRAIIAVHSTARGPAAGGCRMWPYASTAEAVADVLRLSRGMSYKNALAGVPFGGGKAVIIGEAHKAKTPPLLEAFGRFVDSLAGRYIAAEDVGTTIADMAHVARATRYVSGLGAAPGRAGGDPGPKTALGVYLGIKAAVRFRLGRADLNGVTVAVQGAGGVGYHLCGLLATEGARVFVADVRPAAVQQVCEQFGARAVAVEDILAMGGTAVICTEDEDLRERISDIAGHDGVSKAIDCVSGQVGADVSRALAPHGELVVYGALSTHRQTDPDKLTIPIFARSLIYETKTVRGFWLFRWFTETPKDRMAAAIDRTLQLADSGALRVPEGQPILVEKFSEAVYLAEAPAHGGKPLLVFEP